MPRGGDGAVAVSPEGDEEEEEPSNEERKPRMMADPRKPSKAEVEAHEMYHLPYRSWCEVCVRGRGKSLPHKVGRHERGLP